MTTEDIIRLAREAGFTTDSVEVWIDDYDGMCTRELERLVALAYEAGAAAERKRLTEQLHSCHPQCDRPSCVAVREAVAAERESCAKVCEQTDEDGEGPDCWGWHAKDYAKAIRARSKEQGMNTAAWQRHRYGPGVEVEFAPRAEYRGRKAIPTLAALAGARLWVRPLWLMDEHDPYPGEWALGHPDRRSDVIGGLIWIASGDVSFPAGGDR